MLDQKIALAIFRDKLLIENNNCCNLYSSLHAIFSSCFISLAEQRMFVSSANKINFTSLETLHMSLMYRINILGPSIDPCGTPHVILCVPEL